MHQEGLDCAVCLQPLIEASSADQQEVASEAAKSLRFAKAEVILNLEDETEILEDVRPFATEIAKLCIFVEGWTSEGACADPIRVRCGHIFGKECFAHWSSSKAMPTSPCCRAENLNGDNVQVHEEEGLEENPEEDLATINGRVLGPSWLIRQIEITNIPIERRPRVNQEWEDVENMYSNMNIGA